jgi:hypothetical protein
MSLSRLLGWGTGTPRSSRNPWGQTRSGLIEPAARWEAVSPSFLATESYCRERLPTSCHACEVGELEHHSCPGRIWVESRSSCVRRC